MTKNEILAALGWDAAPALLPEVLAALELHGTDSCRGILASSADGTGGSGRLTPLRLGDAVLKRGEIEDWLKWKAARDVWWVKASAIAATAAAVFSLAALFR